MTRLSDSLHAAAGEPVDLDLDAVHAGVDRRRRRRSRIRAAGGAMAASLLLVGVVALAASASDDRPDVRAGEVGPGGETTEPVPTSTEPPVTESSTTSPGTTVPEPSTTSTSTTTTTSTEPAPTTEPPPTTDTVPPSTTAPEPTEVRLQGTYVVHTPGPAAEATCAAGEMAVGLDGTITTADGAAWRRTELGCATIHDDVYRGQGTFVLTGPDGGTLTGTFLSVAELPTDGVPYALVITGGSGPYAGATGGCDLTVQIVDGSGLTQRQEGSITCTATRPGIA